MFLRVTFFRKLKNEFMYFVKIKDMITQVAI